MEKLQSAIEKARAQRQGAAVPNAQAPAKAVTPAAGAVADRWAALTPATIPASALRDNLLVSHSGGKEAGPFDMLRTRILQQARTNGWKRVALVSPQSGAGKTTLAANLAFSFGRQSELRTMVLDFDLRRPALARTLGQHPRHTMADVLQGQVAFAEHGLRYGDNVALGLNSGRVEASAEILQTQKTREAIAALEAEYAPDIMLFDMPPLHAADDNFGFLNNVDCALLIAEAERSTVSQIDVAERQLAELTSVMGVVLNKSRYTDGAYGYGYE
jgi:Mrp family chromosome partitioning ATPase